MATITDLVTQNKQAALQKLAAKAANDATAAPIVQLDPAYDTGTAGDNITELLRVNLRVANPAGLTWIDTTPNGTYDHGEPAAVGSTFYDITLTPGNNTFVIYQQASGKNTSQATTLSLYVPPTASYQEQRTDQLLTQLALAYWGRALSPEELALGKQALQQSAGNPQPIIDYLVTTAEYRLVYPAQDPLSLITAPYLKLFGRNPTPSEISFWLTKSSEGLDLHQLPGLLVQNPPSASSDAEALAAKTLVAQLMTTHYDTLLQQANGFEAQLHNTMRNQLDAVVDQVTMNGTITAIANGTPTSVALTAPTLTLTPLDDDGIAGDRVTSKTLVRLTVSNLDAARQNAWIETDGNGQFDLNADIAIPNGSTIQTVWVPLAAGVNGFQVYQTRDGLTSLPGTLSLFRLQTTDVVQPGSAAYAGRTISLEFDRPIDWTKLDANGDSRLSVRNLNDSTDTDGELRIAWGSSGTNPPKLNNTELSAIEISLADLPYGGRFLTLTPVSIAPADPTKDLDGNLTLILVGIPDVQSGIISNVIFTI